MTKYAIHYSTASLQNPPDEIEGGWFATIAKTPTDADKGKPLNFKYDSLTGLINRLSSDAKKQLRDTIGTPTIDFSSIEDKIEALEDRLDAAINRIAKLENIYIISDELPGDGDWKIWVRHSRDYAKWVDFYCVWVRDGETAVEVICTQPEPMAIPTFIPDAIALGDDKYSIRFPGNVLMIFSTKRLSDILQLTFDPGVFNALSLYYLDSSNQPMRSGARAETIGNTETTKGIGRSDAPPGSISVRVDFSRIDGSVFTFIFPLNQ